jgi:geranylgeranyl diphosphate synthase type I
MDGTGVTLADPALAATRLSEVQNERLPAVDALMSELCAGDLPDDPLAEISAEHLASGGKRIRARLALATVAALEGDVDGAVPWAAACELLHNATLIHDDLQDGDVVRRGKPAVWAKHGQAQAINAGDLMLMLPYAAISRIGAGAETKLALMEAVTRHAITTVRGQALELELLKRQHHNGQLKAAYLRGIEGKTSALFELPVEGAALFAGRPAEEALALAAPFRKLGMLFQYQDDVLDLYGDKGREAVGADLREGKVSSLVVEHLHLAPEDQDWLLGVLAAPREETRSEDVTRAITVFRDSGALDAVLHEMEGIARVLIDSEMLRRAPVLQQLAQDFLSLILRPIDHVFDAGRLSARA